MERLAMPGHPAQAGDMNRRAVPSLRNFFQPIGLVHEGGMMRALVVDDELVSRAKLKKILEGSGQCDCVADGSQALGLIATALDQGRPYDLVTLDVAMPSMGGMDVLIQLRQLERTRPDGPNGASKVLMVTAHAERALVAECLQHGCDDYLIKPFKPEEIKRKLRILGLLY